jgi:hypothetical protein
MAGLKLKFSFLAIMKPVANYNRCGPGPVTST